MFSTLFYIINQGIIIRFISLCHSKYKKKKIVGIWDKFMKQNAFI